ncbi:hypothetical protein [Streptomyces albidoflavus]|uniref:hypothetical protein n=1 Tax=Streptomyces albidoflavus TaxID=1886 RepID=UPI003865F157|nr:hypothetical protein OG525_23970 [Streptomyces albidoflavus]
MTSQQLLRQMSTREWERAITAADLVVGPAFAYHLAGGGPAAAVHVATGDSLTDEARQQLITELKQAIDATVARVLSAQIIRTTTRDEEAER